jgi:hypothetical protein
MRGGGGSGEGGEDGGEHVEGVCLEQTLNHMIIHSDIFIHPHSSIHPIIHAFLYL